ncbi:MAG: hydroxypyruvate isomerase family protein [Acidobacteriota bacterium]|jgi:hydroxypyruvate isomerase
MTSRRFLLQAGAALALEQSLAAAPLKGQIQHSVCKWCYPRISLEDLCIAARKIGLRSIELLGPNDWPTLTKHGLTCAMTTAPDIDGLGGITRSFNRLEHHDKLVQIYSDWIPKAAAAGITNLICFSGNRAGLDDEKGLEHCVTGLKRLMSLAEKHKVNLVMELLNSKVNHKDYMCDHTAWGVELCRRVGSERMKLLYDIYHMQIMEGDVIATIRQYHPYFAHYHTGGVPGRNEIDDSQELHYPAIVRAIVATGFKGFIAQEFIPKRPDALASLEQGVQICDV